jgi:hypothetical protein
MSQERSHLKTALARPALNRRFGQFPNLRHRNRRDFKFKIVQRSQSRNLGLEQSRKVERLRNSAGEQRVSRCCQ